MQMKRVLVVLAVAALVSSVAIAEVRSTDQTARNGISSTRMNGTLGSFSGSIVQTGPLQVDYTGTVTTAGGDGQPLVTVFGTQTYTLDDQVWLLVQIYDSPWTAHTFATTQRTYFTNSPTALGSFSATFSTAVPRAANYQLWLAALAGHTWPGTSYYWFDISQGLTPGGSYLSHYAGPLATTPVDSTQPPTPTPPPGGYGGNPIPTLNWLGILAMIAIMVGVAVLVMTRK